MEGYETTIEDFNVTNTHTPETVEFSGSKTWYDADNQDGIRPESITINLLADGEVIDTITVGEAEKWSWSFTELPKYRDQGVEIVYTITEEAVKDYTTSIDGFNVTNTHTPATVEVDVTKVWDDANDQDGLRPDMITVILKANGEKTDKALVLNEGNNWTGSFFQLDKFEAGKEIAYTVAEVEVDNYTSKISGTQTEGYLITNTHIPAEVEIAGVKTWKDNNNQDGKRPDSITIRLLADGEEIKSVTVTEADAWSWSFTDLPEFKNHGTAIVYTITEDAVDDYTGAIDGFNVTNSYTPEKTGVTVTKSWKDNDDQDGIRPEKITVNLLADGKKVASQKLTADANWTYTFTDLDKYAEGKIIVYTIEEEAVEGYETVISGDQTKGFTITNTHSAEVIKISGTKTWNDFNNNDGKRPDSITVNLMANGKKIRSIQVTAENNWTYSFDNLPKFESGKEILYTVTEDAVEDYTVTYEGFNIVNTYTPEKTSITVTKRWVDGHNHDGLRPSSVTVVLYADGVRIADMLLTRDGKWTGVFTGLPVYHNGEKIVYTIQEKAVSGYYGVISGNAAKGFVVTNTRNEIPKTGDDSNLPMHTVMFAASISMMAVLMFLAKPRKREFER